MTENTEFINEHYAINRKINRYGWGYADCMQCGKENDQQLPVGVRAVCHDCHFALSKVDIYNCKGCQKLCIEFKDKNKPNCHVCIRDAINRTEYLT